MFSNLFSGGTNKKIHCEMTGKKTSIDKTRVLTKINGIISLQPLRNAEVDYDEKVIYSNNKTPINFFSKVYTPQNLKAIFGDLFSSVDDEDDIEHSTNILSDEGMKIFMGRQLMRIHPDYFLKYAVIKFSDTMFIVSVNDISNFSTQTKTCECWGIDYQSFGKKYMTKKILETKNEPQIFGSPSILWPGFDVKFGDCSDKNPNGTGYLFKTDRNFAPSNFCCNESAVDFCSKNNCLAYYIDFMNGGKMRVLSKFTPSINSNLQNDYKFRSSNI